MLIDYAFFQGPLFISGIISPDVAPSLTTSAITGDVNNYISYYETEYLIKVLGKEVYEQFSEYLQSEEKEPVKLWDDLKSMLVGAMGGMKISPIANYIYFFYTRNHQCDVTINGVKRDSDVGDLVSPMGKMVSAWNNMVRMNADLYKWLDTQHIEGWTFDKSLLRPVNTFNL
nr:MAG TPA: hypothetical protein [Caudoviricetes sp.]